MLVQVFSGGPFFVNTYVVYSRRNGAGVIIDPGNELVKIKSFVLAHHINVHSILLTHGHVDHILHINGFKALTRAAIRMHAADRELYGGAAEMARFFGLMKVETPAPIDETFVEGDTFPIGEQSLRVLETPGHSPGSVCFVADGEFVITGDTLFNDGIGRTDLKGGSYPDIMTSIKTKLLTLPEDLVVYPGHGPSSTIGFEKTNNPFLE
jgi:hydroxyacylglutathione hydrolase